MIVLEWDIQKQEMLKMYYKIAPALYRHSVGVLLIFPLVLSKAYGGIVMLHEGFHVIESALIPKTTIMLT